MKPWKLASRRTIFSSVPFSIREDRLICPHSQAVRQGILHLGRAHGENRYLTTAFFS